MQHSQPCPHTARCHCCPKLMEAVWWPWESGGYSLPQEARHCLGDAATSPDLGKVLDIL
jgi:hypothetical protein